MLRCLLTVAFLASLPACARRGFPTLDAGEHDSSDGAVQASEDSGIHQEMGEDAGLSDSGTSAPDAGLAPAQDAASSEPDAGQADAGPTDLVMRSTMVGGTQGGAFDDSSLLPAAPQVKSITLRAGDRLDGISLLLRDGTTFTHGGSGGSAKTLELAQGEVFTYARLCSGEHDGSIRVFYARLGTSLGHEIAGGVETSTCTNLAAPMGHQISALYGRAGAEVDALGFVYTPIVP